MKEKVLIDLTKIGNPTCGFGTIALAYEELYAAYEGEEFEFILLVPENYQGRFTDKVKYVHATSRCRRHPALLPEVKIWHTTTQQLVYLRLAEGTKQVLTIHDLNFLYEKSWYSILKHLYQMRRYIKKATVVTAISEYVRQDILTHIPMRGKEVQVIYNGVDAIYDKPAVRPAFVSDRPFFFTIGQVRKKKNFHVLLEVMKFFPEYDLYICGDDHFKYADTLKKQIREKGLNRVHVTGTITFAGKIWLYQHCAAFLFPSKLEGFGIPVLEAMQFGKPVFSSSCSSLPEVCNGHAFLWENFEAEPMARLIKEKLEDFYAHPQKIEAARQYALSFTYRRHFEAYLQIYRQLLQE